MSTNDEELAAGLDMLMMHIGHLVTGLRTGQATPERRREVTSLLEQAIDELRAHVPNQHVADHDGSRRGFSASGSGAPIVERGVNWRSGPAHHQEVTDVGDSGGR